MRCPNCRKEISGDYKFCPYCASSLTPMQMRCPNCGSSDFPSDSKYCPECGCKLREDVNAPLSQKDSVVMNLDSEVTSRLQSLGYDGCINISSSESKETPYLLEATSICIICPGKSAVEIGRVTISNIMEKHVIGYCDAIHAVVIKKVLSLVGVSVKISVSDDLSPMRLFSYKDYGVWEKKVRQDYYNLRGQAIANGAYDQNGRRLSDAEVVNRFEKNNNKWFTHYLNDVNAFSFDVAREYHLADSDVYEIKWSAIDRAWVSLYCSEENSPIADYHCEEYTDAEALCISELLGYRRICAHITRT